MKCLKIGKLHKITNKLTKYKTDITLQETRWKGQGTGFGENSDKETEKLNNDI